MCSGGSRNLAHTQMLVADAGYFALMLTREVYIWLIYKVLRLKKMLSSKDKGLL